MKITIEVEIPKGYEFVRYGIPKKDERYLASNGSIHTVCHDNYTYKEIIIREIWVRPEWMKPGWIAKDQNGDWYWYSEKPGLQDSSLKTYWNGADNIDLTNINWTPPENNNWKQSILKV